MSDYLTRLVERSLGLVPRVEPLIASIHAPSDQELRARAEASAVFEPDRPVATIEMSQKEAPPDAVVNPTGGEPAPSPTETESESPRLSSPVPASQTIFPIQKKGDRPAPAESRPKASSDQTASAPQVEAADIVAAPASARPASPDAALKEPQEMTHEVPERKIVRPGKPETAFPVREVESSPTETSLLPRTPTLIPEITSEVVVHPRGVPPPKPAASTTVSKDTNQIVVQPEIKPAVAAPLPVRQSSSNEPPAIHVTIGRIEVRAVTPPGATPKAAPSTAPRLSLEDYLKRRNGRSA